jgi:peptidoglycan/xylan/chitin deacetylase (PgdA/CDA1 family)
MGASIGTMENIMAQETIDRRSRRRKRAGLWLFFVVAFAFFPLNFNFPGTSTWAPWLIIPIFVLLVAHRWMKDEGGVPIITYHSVSDDQSWLPWSAGAAVTPETFERQMRTLRKMGCNIISTFELIDSRKERRPLPSKPVAIHFDDGYVDNWTAAFPILKRHGLRATVFASVDFIEDGEEIRPNLEFTGPERAGGDPIEWRGYLNWAELRTMDASEFVDVQSHGTDHGRVRTGPAAVDRLTPANWRRHAWVQWAAANGNKSGWFRHADPQYVPYGTDVYESGPALASTAWIDGVLESQAEYETRVRVALESSRSVLEAALQKKIRVFCWPYNSATQAGRRIAEETGHWASTGGRGENRLDEDPRVISRMSVHERVLGIRWDWLDCLAFRARVRLGHGNYYWYLPLIVIKLAGLITKPLLGRTQR